MTSDGEFPQANPDSIAAWNANAAFWDDAQGDNGNFWQRELIFPPTLELLSPLPARVLEIACGNGNFARALASRGVQVTATDASQQMLDLARSRTSDPEQRIRWRRVDAASPDDLAAIPGQPFDAAVCNMALMDIAALDPLFHALPGLLQPAAPFVFSVLHPAFSQGPATSLFIERRETAAGRFVEQRGVRISSYRTARREDGVAVVGQPRLQPYFLRPLEVLLGAAFQRGWALDALREPTFPPLPGGDPDDHGRFTWQDVPEIPPLLIARLRHTA